MPPAQQRADRRPSGRRNKARIAVAVAGQNTLAAAYVRRILRGRRGFDVRPCEASSPPSPSRPVICIADARHLEGHARASLRRLRAALALRHVIAVHDFTSDDDFFRLLAAGVRGFVRSDEAERDLVKAARAVVQGRLWIPREILERYVEYRLPVRRGSDPQVATPRELQIAELLRKCFSNKEIASALGISEGAVKFHLSNMFTKFAVHSRYDLAARGRERAVDRRGAGESPWTAPATSSWHAGVPDHVPHGAATGDR